MRFLFITVMLLCVQLFGLDFQAKDYSGLIQKMPEIDSHLLQIHFKLYEGYVDQVNLLNKMAKEELSKAADGQPFMYQSMKRQYGWEYDGMVLHELYFDNLGGDGKILPKSSIANKIRKQYGSFDAWKSDFEQNCLIRGIGWVVLYWNPKTDELKNAWIQEHSTGPFINCVPLLVIDLWEHAYLCQFGLDRRKYIQTIMKYINWDVVNKRLM